MPTRPGTHKRRAPATAKHEPPDARSWRAGKTTAQRGYGGRWQKARSTFLKRNPLCVMCEAEGKPVPAKVVDHKRPHRGDQSLFWDTENWQPLCKRHHDEKTAREDGGFGNDPTSKETSK